jgi:radical SAM superfamily enzyme YgiQ (UPF0313 family)
MKESPVIQKAWKKSLKRMAIVYPNKYYGGVYALGALVIYNLVNSIEGWVCERRFIEDATDLANFDLVGFTWQYELDIYNIKSILENNDIKCPTFAGGPCVNNNPKAMEDGLDFFVNGEVEKILPQILSKVGDGFLDKIEKLKGVYIPGKTKEITFAESAPFDSYPIYQPMPEGEVKNLVFGKVFMLETERGCPFNCNFCALPKEFGIRYRSLESIKKIIDDGLKLNDRQKVVIYTASFTHPDKKEIMKYLLSKKVRFNVPSIRIETIDDEALELIHQGGQKSLTIAPECGESLRSSLNKHTKDSMYFDFLKKASKFTSIKMYYMLGIPGQDEKDLDEIINFLNKSNEMFKGKIYASFNPFVPKKKTPFQDHQYNKFVVKKQMNYLKKNLKVKVKFASVDTAAKVYRIAQL